MHADNTPPEEAQADTAEVDDAAEKTQPPVSALRYESPAELYTAIPQIKRLIQHRPREDEDAMAFLSRLRSSTTPEEAVTYTAFAARTKMAIWWGYECVRTLPDELTETDRELMEMVAHWTTYPDAENRYKTMRAALWQTPRTPAVMLALAVGWSGGQIAPNDPAPVPLWRSPRSINSAVLSCLSKVDLDKRSVLLARFIDLSAALFRVY